MTVTRQIKEYLHSTQFRNALVGKYSRFEILSEAALRTTIANLLGAKIRALASEAEGYRVTCEVHLPGAKVVPDILIWKNRHPRIWIELKATRHFDSTKAGADWDKLQTHCTRFPSVKAGYLIYVAKRNRGSMGIKRNNDTRRLWPIAIGLSDEIEDFEKWYGEYKRRAHYNPTSKSRISKPVTG